MKKLDNLKVDITFEKIHFSYPQRAEVSILNGLNLKIPAGKIIALCGTSGSGKSTLFSLLSRFHLPNMGEIKLDGHLIDDLDLL